MLKFKVSKEEYDKLDDAIKAFYKADGDNFMLEAEGAVDKSKLDEFRQTNVDLLKKQKSLEGVDLEKYNNMLETERKIRDKELIDKGDIDTLIEERLAAQKSDYEAKLVTAQGNAETATGKYHSLVSKTEIEGAAFKAFGLAKIRPDAHDAVMAQIKSKFSVGEDGMVIAKDGDKILTGADGNLTIAEFDESQPDFMRVPNTPGGGDGNDHGKPPKEQGTSSQEKIQKGLKELMDKKG